MKLPPVPHEWNLAPRAAIELQRALAEQVRVVPLARQVRHVAGLDAAFSPDGRYCLAAVVVWDLREKVVVEQRTARQRLVFPYVPGLLSFREAPALLEALRRLRRRPDVLMCDGQGLAHPRRFGIACHVGVVTGLPAVGCAKSRLIGRHDPPAEPRGSQTPLWVEDEVVGAVLRTRDGVRPLYISVGHRMTLTDAVELTLACGGGFRLPEPTRLADRLVAREKQRGRRAEEKSPAG
jgi:deoxyribonuclease V